jgi:hypothetical protein
MGLTTGYDNNCYKIDNTDWAMLPGSKFVDHNGKEKSFVDYYKEHYSIAIKGRRQPMLINRDKVVALVPELCNLTNPMKNDFGVRKDVAMSTRVRSAQRKLTEIKFLLSKSETAGASSHLLNWRPRLAPDAVKLEGRLLNPEKSPVLASQSKGYTCGAILGHEQGEKVQTLPSPHQEDPRAAVAVPYAVKNMNNIRSELRICPLISNNPSTQSTQITLRGGNRNLPLGLGYLLRHPRQHNQRAWHSGKQRDQNCCLPP